MKSERNVWAVYAIYATVLLLTVGMLQSLFPEAIPFRTWDVWQTRMEIGDWLAAGWPFLAWGFAAQTVIMLARWDGRLMPGKFEGLSPGAIFIAGAKISVRAGVCEEIIYRWLLFFLCIVGAKLMNFLFFGFMGFGLIEFLHLELFGPIADVTTLGALHNWLFSPESWAVGAGLIAVNARFRDGHAYQGVFGLINSWFAGMFLFWVMFTYGLPVAILLHFLYDLIVFSLVAAFAAIRR